MASKKKGFREIPIADIDVSHLNVRKENVQEGLNDLAASIDAHGLLQPVVVFWDAEKDKYQLIIGQRRFLACRDKLRMRRIPARIISLKNDTEAALLSFSENIHRLDLEYRDKMAVATQLLAHLKSVKKVADALGVSGQTVRNYLGYAGVPDAVKAFVDEGKISASTAIRIAKSVPDEEKAVEIAEKVHEELTDDKRRLILDIAKDNPEKSASEVASIAKRQKFKSITVHLTPKVAQAIQLACTEYTTEPSDLAQNALEEWLRRENFLI